MLLIAFLLSENWEWKNARQTYFDVVAKRITQLRAATPDLILAIDGAVKKDNVGELATMQPDLIVTGSAIFDGNDPVANIAHMKDSIQKASTNS